MTTVTYAKGLHDLGNGCYAWLQPDGGWGLSNSGLVTGSGASLLIDTLYDLTSTREMLDGIAILTDRNPIATVVNTHSDGDHYFGNQLVAGGGVQIIASQAAAELMTQESVEEMARSREDPGRESSRRHRPSAAADRPTQSECRR